MQSKSIHLLLSLVLPSCLIVSCSRPSVPPPTLDELKNATFAGLDRGMKEVTLVNGVWEGEPFVKEGASRPRVELVDDFLVSGDLDSNGIMEAIVLLTETSGGSAVYIYMAAAHMIDGKIINPGTELLGDRIQVREIRISGGTLYLDIVEHAPFDPLCCPGQLVTKEWKLLPKGFALHSLRSPGRLSPELMAGSEWVLERWNINEPVQPGTEITLTYQEGRFVGKSGCNQYFASVTAGSFAGDIKVEPPGSTRMACPETEMAVESRFLTRLGQAGRFGFTNGRLALTTGGNDSLTTLETLLFSKRIPDQAGSEESVKQE